MISSLTRLRRVLAFVALGAAILILINVCMLQATTEAFTVQHCCLRHAETKGINSPSETKLSFHYMSSLTILRAEKKSMAPSTLVSNSLEPDPQQKSENRRVALLVCPAQFCVPDDYEELWQALPSEIQIVGNASATNTSHSSSAITTSTISIDQELSRVVPLSRRDWIKVSKQLPTQRFWNASLQVHETLDWYFDALEKGLIQILSEEEQNQKNHVNIDNKANLSICLVGHSIGGWVARAYLGGLSRSSTSIFRIAQDQISSLITLGTPHISPTSALVDQTRGLLREIAEAPACSSRSLIEDRGIEVTCVCSSSLSGKFLTSNIEEFVAASSYLPLLGRAGGDIFGDGIVPLDLAFMEAPARRLVVPACPETGLPIRHSHVLPTPWNLWNAYAASIRLDDQKAVSYISPKIVLQWAQYIR